MDIERIIKDYIEQLYAHTFYNLDDIDHSLKDILLKLTQEVVIRIGLYLLKKLNQ